MSIITTLLVGTVLGFLIGGFSPWAFYEAGFWSVTVPLCAVVGFILGGFVN